MVPGHREPRSPAVRITYLSPSRLTLRSVSERYDVTRNETIIVTSSQVALRTSF